MTPISDEEINEIALRVVYEGDERIPYRADWCEDVGRPFARAIEAKVLDRARATAVAWRWRFRTGKDQTWRHHEVMPGFDANIVEAVPLYLGATVAPSPEELAKLQKRYEHSKQWYAARFERLFRWAHEELNEEQKTRYFNIVANGSADWMESPRAASGASPEPTAEAPKAWEIIHAAEDAGLLELSEPYLSDGDRQISDAGKQFIKGVRRVFDFYVKSFKGNARSLAVGAEIPQKQPPATDRNVAVGSTRFSDGKIQTEASLADEIRKSMLAAADEAIAANAEHPVEAPIQLPDEGGTV